MRNQVKPLSLIDYFRFLTGTFPGANLKKYLGKTISAHTSISIRGKLDAQAEEDNPLKQYWSSGEENRRNVLHLVLKLVDQLVVSSAVSVLNRTQSKTN